MPRRRTVIYEWPKKRACANARTLAAPLQASPVRRFSDDAHAVPCRGFVSLFLIQFPALLTQEGHEVHMANDGPSGLRAALTFRPDAEVITSSGKSTAARSMRYNS